MSDTFTLDVLAIAAIITLIWVSCGDLASAIEREWFKDNNLAPPPPENATENMLLGPLALIAAMLTYNA